MEKVNSPDMQTTKAPTVLDGLMQPGFPVKVFTCLFFESCVVFCKTGSFATNSAGTMQRALGGFTSSALVMGGIGTVLDYHSREDRVNKAAAVASYHPQDIVAVHKRNFLLKYENITGIELKGPNFAGELRIVVYAEGKKHKFRMDKQSKTAAKYVIGILNEFIPGKVNPL